MKIRNRPSFDELTKDEKLNFGNGIGPDWFPSWLRYFITQIMLWFFQSASWRHHDFGYVVGGDFWDRMRCDWKFFKAMLKDAFSQPKYRIIRIPLAVLISIIFYFAVLLFGGFKSFAYRDRYATIDQIRNNYC